MFEAAVRDGFQELWLEQEVAEGGRVNTDVGSFALLGAGSSRGEVTLLRVAVGRACCSSGAGTVGGLYLIVGVVDQFFFCRHGEGGLLGW